MLTPEQSEASTPSCRLEIPGVDLATLVPGKVEARGEGVLGPRVAMEPAAQ